MIVVERNVHEFCKFQAVVSGTISISGAVLGRFDL